MGIRNNKPFWRRLFVICGLAAAAFVAPILDIYGRNPEVFVANRTSAPEIVLFGLVVAFWIPLLAFVALWIADLIGGKAPDVIYWVIVGLLALGTGLVISRQLFPESNILAVGSALAAGAVVMYLVRSFEAVLAWFGLALPIVLVMFLVTSDSSRLISDSGVGGSEAETVVGNPAPIVIVQLDEMPIASIMDENGDINSVLFPNFARLAAQGTWYRNAMSSSIATTQSVPAILSGRLGEKGMSPSFVDYPRNIFTLLEGAYEMHVIEWVADLCPNDVCPEYAGRSRAHFRALLADVGVVYGHLTLPPWLRDQLPSIDNAWKGFLGQLEQSSSSEVEIEGVPVPQDGSRVDWADWIQRITNGIEAGGSPTLSYAHVQAPHVPWETNPTGTHYDRPEQYTEVEGVEGNGRWGPEEAPTLLGFQRHLYQIGFLDLMLGRLFNKLDSTGTWDETMVVVVADHGASFVPGEHRRWPYDDNRIDLYRVPMFVKYPGQTVGEVDDTPAYGIDLLPSMVEALSIETDWDFDGVSLLSVGDIDRPHTPVWWCCNGEGIDTDVTSLLDQVGMNYDRIPDQGSWLAVAGVGPNAGLIGQPVTSLGVAHGEGIRWSLDRGAQLAEVDITAGKVQTLWTGRIELPPDNDTGEVLLVVNGTVAGVGYITRDSADGGSIRGLIAEELVVDGHNDLDVIVPDGEGTWLSGVADVIELVLVAPDGRILEISPEGNRRIQVDQVVTTETGWSVVGWAADISKKVPPDMIYLFAGDILVAHGPPNQDNKNVVRWFDSETLLASGFSFDVAEQDVPANIDQLTVVAEFGTQAVADPARLTR